MPSSYDVLFRRAAAGAACVLWAVVLSACGNGEEELSNTLVTIESSPEQGAKVMVDGREYGETPVAIEGLDPGLLDVMLKKPDYRVATDRIRVQEGPAQTFVIEMEPLTGQLSIESDPSGAKVFIDGEFVRETPLVAYDLPVGEHTYELRLENYYAVENTLEVQKDYRYEKRHELKPKEGTILVTSRPTRAQITINNQPQTEETPAKFELDPGTYLIGVYAKGYVQEEQKVELPPAEEVSVSLVMKPGQVPAGMVLVPAGEFIMGADNRAPDEAPKRKVFVDAYYIDKTEVTNREYQSAVPSHSFPEGQADMPVTGISWNEATDYAKAVGKRLPTEAEWEKAARGTDGRAFPWGNEFDKELCNSIEADVGGVAPVGTFLGGASPYGCLDMAGNVFEWTVDWYQAYPGNNLVTKDYGQVFRVLRGGSYQTPRFDVRCARRRFDKMDSERADYGFRCVKDIAPLKK